MTYVLSVKDEFSSKPLGRKPEDDYDCGERFRRGVLATALARNQHVTVDFTGIATVGASFLDEAIAGLVFHDGMTGAQVRERIALIIPSDPTKVETAWEWVRRAEASKRNNRLAAPQQHAHA